MLLKVCHLYPDLLNLYGDRGNVLIFCRRAAWRGIRVQLDLISLPDRVRFADYDFIFVGGGADLEQGLVSRDLEQKGPLLIDAVEQGVALLSICGGYQLLGRYYRARDGSVLPGVGLFDLYTEAGSRRLKGNILLQMAPELEDEAAWLRSGDTARLQSEDVAERPRSEGEAERNREEAAARLRPKQPVPEHNGDAARMRSMRIGTLVGFENHSGRTFLGGSVLPLARVIRGNGNNGKDGTEGVSFKNAFGTYLHGPFLSKNPHFADLLIARALSRRCDSFTLAPLDDTLELHAHRVMRDRLR
jgi:hypothetical protein